MAFRNPMYMSLASKDAGFPQVGWVTGMMALLFARSLSIKPERHVFENLLVFVADHQFVRRMHVDLLERWVNHQNIR